MGGWYFRQKFETQSSRNNVVVDFPEGTGSPFFVGQRVSLTVTDPQNRHFEFTMHSVQLDMDSTHIRYVMILMILIGETHITGGHGSCRGLEGDFYSLFF